MRLIPRRSCGRGVCLPHIFEDERELDNVDDLSMLLDDVLGLVNRRTLPGAVSTLFGEPDLRSLLRRACPNAHDRVGQCVLRSRRSLHVIDLRD